MTPKQLICRKTKQPINSFSFSKTGCHTKVKDLSLPCYLSIAGGIIVLCIPLPRVLSVCETQSRIRFELVSPSPFPSTVAIKPRITCCIVIDDCSVGNGWSSDWGETTKKRISPEMLDLLLFYSFCSVSKAVEERGNRWSIQCARLASSFWSEPALFVSLNGSVTPRPR